MTFQRCFTDQTFLNIYQYWDDKLPMTPKSQATTNCTLGVLWKAFCLFFFFKHILYMPYDYTLSKLLLFPCYSLDPVFHVRWRIPGLMAFKSVVLLLWIYAWMCVFMLSGAQICCEEVRKVLILDLLSQNAYEVESSKQCRWQEL